MTDLTSIALALFLIANPIGNTPAILAVVRAYSFEQQKKIILRESIIALLLALFFQFFGDVFFSIVKVQNWAIGFSGGVLLLIVALKMIFPRLQDDNIPPPAEKMPFVVPIATPIISGPGVLTMIMLFSSQEQNNLKMTLAILLAWIGVIAVMISGPYLQKFLKKRGMAALEQLMGMMLAFMSIDLIVRAATQFLGTL